MKRKLVHCSRTQVDQNRRLNKSASFIKDAHTCRGPPPLNFDPIRYSPNESSPSFLQCIPHVNSPIMAAASRTVAGGSALPTPSCSVNQTAVANSRLRQINRTPQQAGREGRVPGWEAAQSKTRWPIGLQRFQMLPWEDGRTAVILCVNVNCSSRLIRKSLL